MWTIQKFLTGSRTGVDAFRNRLKERDIGMHEILFSRDCNIDIFFENTQQRHLIDLGYNLSNPGDES